MVHDFQHHQSVQVKISPSIREQATYIAQLEGVSLNYFISVALAEKLERLDHPNDSNGHTQPDR